MSLWDKSFTPMLLKEVKKPFDSKDYIYEVKYDGIRAIIFIKHGSVIIKSRNNTIVTDIFPELKSLSMYIKSNVILDGEIIIFDKGKVSFSKLQKRFSLKNKKTIEYLSKTNPVLFVCFDILYENKDITNYTLIKRKEILDKYKDNEYFVKAKYIKKDGKKLFDIIKKLNMEGIVAKEVNSKYYINKRSSSWLKIKNYKYSYFYIMGYTYKEGSNKLVFLLGEYVNNKLECIGKASVGKKSDIAKLVLSSEGIKNNDIVYLKSLVKCKVGYLEKIGNSSLRHPFIT